MLNLIIKDSSFGYYITPVIAPMDNIVAQNICMSERKYQNFLIRRFNGELGFAANVYFKNKEDAERALEWVKSIIVLEKLRGDV